MVLPSWLRRMIDIGVAADMRAIDARHIRATNIIALLAGVSRLGPISSALSHGEIQPLVINLMLLCLQPLVLYLNARKQHLAASLVLTITGKLMLTMAALVMGVSPPVLLFFIVFVVLPYILLPRQNRNIAHGLALYSALGGAFFSTFQGSFASNSVAMMSPVTKGVNSLIAVSFMLVSCITFIRTIEESENSLLEEKQAQSELLRQLREEKETQVELNEQLRLANEHKSKFLAGMSHELRTPLNAIIGFTRIVRRKSAKDLAQKQQDNLDKVLSSAEHLLGLINDILDIAKIEAGQMDLRCETFLLGDLVEEVAKGSESLLQEGVSIKVDVAPALSPIRSDPARVKQILLNLVSNSAKFTHEGEITIGVSPWQGGLTLTVEDTGIGISEEAMGRIFREFQQADSGTTRKYGGTGLGLSISLHLAKMLGGELSASSVEGKGSIFTLRLPRDAEEQEEAPTEKNTPTPQERAQASGVHPLILLIDDQPNDRYLLREALEGMDFEVVEAGSGEEGIAKACELAPFAILLDVLMPKKDGWQVLYELKQMEPTKHIPTVVASVVDNEKMAIKLGAAGFLSKPLDEEKTKTLFSQLQDAKQGG